MERIDAVDRHNSIRCSLFSFLVAEHVYSWRALIGREDDLRMSLSTKRINCVLAIGLCAALFAGCGRGADVGTSAVLPQSQDRVSNAQSMVAAQGNVMFSIGVTPKTKAGRITPNDVSPSTQSLQILTDGVNPVVVNLTPSSPNCSPNTTVPGAYVCRAFLIVLAGNHVFTVTTYDLTGATGNVLSTNSTGTVYVKPIHQTTRISIVLKGVVRHVILTLATTNPPVGIAATIGLTAIPKDADGNLIVGPAPFEHPVTLTTSDAANGPLSKTTLNSPADLAGITAAYNGAGVASISYSTIAADVPAANVISADLTPGASKKHLYVTTASSFTLNTVSIVSVFDLEDPKAAPTTITGGGLSSPVGLAIDASGKLYVANEPTPGQDSPMPSILVFDTAHGNAVLPPITGAGLNVFTGAGLNRLVGVALDASGKLYVLNSFVNAGYPVWDVLVFDTAHGNAVLPPIRPALSSGELYYPFGVAVDASGKLYVAHYSDLAGTSTVRVFDTSHANVELPPITGGGLYFYAGGVAVDASGRLYVSNLYGDAPISIFDTAHGNAPMAAITGPGLSDPGALAIDASGKLYVLNTNYSISIYDTAHGNAALLPINGVDFPGVGGAVAVH
jgi:hypothetical protein